MRRKIDSGVNWAAETGKPVIFENFTVEGASITFRFLYEELDEFDFRWKKFEKVHSDRDLYKSFGDSIRKLQDSWHRTEIIFLLQRQAGLWERMTAWKKRLVRKKDLVPTQQRQEWRRQQRAMNKRGLPGR